MKQIPESALEYRRRRKARRDRNRAKRSLSVAVYERVSLDRQEFRSQHSAVETYCRRQGWRKLAVYAEKESRSSVKRTELDRLLQDARLGKFDVVVIFRIDRLGSRPSYIHQVVEELQHLKIRFVSVADHIDTADPSGSTEIKLGFMATIASADLRAIRERSKAGIEAARRRGTRLGRPPLSVEKFAHVKALIEAGKTTAEIHTKTGASVGVISKIRNGYEPA